jgi:hypothetical protein
MSFVPNTDAIIKGFPHHAIITTLHGKQNFNILHKQPQLLSDTIMSVGSYRGGGNFGHLGALLLS